MIGYIFVMLYSGIGPNTKAWINPNKIEYFADGIKTQCFVGLEGIDNSLIVAEDCIALMNRIKDFKK